MAIKKRMKDGTIKYVTYKHEEDNQKNVSESEILEDSQKDKDIARLTALVETLRKELQKRPKEESPSSDVMAVAAASTYSCYK